MKQKNSGKKESGKDIKNKRDISAKTALFLSSAVLFLCAAMLFVSIFLVQTSDSEKLTASNSIVSASIVKDSSCKTPATKQSNEQEVITLIDEYGLSNIGAKKNDNQINPESIELSEKRNNKEKSGKDKKTAKMPAEKVNVEKNKAEVYILLDDAGHNLSQLKVFLDLNFALTIAVLPKVAHTTDCAKAIVSSGKSLMLHQPMQAVNRSVDPGPGAIEPEMSAEKVRAILLENIFELNNFESGNGKLLGMNNHEGSLITTNVELMRTVMEVCREEKIFFLDSRTNAKSICRQVAQDTGITFFERNIFLDNTPRQSDMEAMFRKGIEIAEKKGSVIMIGHIWSGKNLADVLQKMYSEYSAQGYKFVSF
ncbi:MAG: divergent polysaccharide deacetylase family protein [Treponemataceae bacterium]